MIVILKHVFLVLIVLAIHSSSAFSQQEFPKPVISDSVSYRYSLVKGDTLLYEVISRDSIITGMRSPVIVKNRREVLLIACDSVTPNGIMYISQRMIDFSSKESDGISKPSIRSFSPWKNIKIWFSMDSTGKRYDFGGEDSLVSAVSPGGPFAPFLFIPLGNGNHLVNSGWLLDDTCDVPENAIPVPIIKHISSMRARPNIDTLGQLCNRLENTITAQGGFFSSTPAPIKSTIQSNAIIAAFGIMDISTTLHIPIHYFGTSELKLNVKSMSNGKSSQVQIKHFIASQFTLKKMVSSRFSDIFIKGSKLKKNRRSR